MTALQAVRSRSGREAHISPEQVRERLASLEGRDITTTQGSAGEFLAPCGVPGVVADAFRPAAHARTAGAPRSCKKPR